jgi:uncharacterized membrane protein
MKSSRKLTNTVIGATLLATGAGVALAQDPATVAATGIDPVALVMRWVHILSAITLLGGSIFFRFVLLPAANQILDPETHERLRPAIVGRWKKIVMALILLFLISGFYTYIMVGVPAHKGDSTYHMLFGIKFLLALVVFFLVSLLSGRTSLAMKLQANAKLWMLLTILTGVVIVGIAGVMKML